MAVQKSKKSRAKRDTRRGPDRLTAQSLAVDPVSGVVHRRHHVGSNGFYRGEQVIRKQEDKDTSE